MNPGMKIILLFIFPLFFSGCATPLMKAVGANDLNTVRDLLDKGGNVNEANLGGTLLCHAVLTGHPEMVKLILDRHADINAPCNESNPLCQAARDGSVEMITLLLDRGADISAVCGGFPALCRAARGGHMEAIRLLLARGADIDASCYGDTALGWAVYEGQMGTARFLLDRGADLDATVLVQEKYAAKHRDCGQCRAGVERLEKLALEWPTSQSYGYEPPQIMPPASAKTTVLVVAPFLKEPESAFAEQTFSPLAKGFSKSMGAALGQIIAAKGLTAAGPYPAVDDLTYQDKKNADLALVPRVFVTARVGYPNDWTEGGGDLRRTFAMDIGGWVSFEMKEPVTGEKIWVRKLDFEDRTVEGAEIRKAIPKYEQRWHDRGMFENAGFSQVLVGYDQGIVRYDGKAAVLAHELKKEIYPAIMAKAWKILDARELSQLKARTAEIRARGEAIAQAGSGGLSKGELKDLVQAAVAGAAQAQKKPEAAAIKSDVDQCSERRAERPDDYAVVVGIEKYSDLPDAQFAERDAEAVKNHLIALGYPSRNVVLLSGEKAGYKSIEKFIETWLPRQVNEKSRVFFYFSGHGAPDVKTGQAYLVPWDGDANFLENTGYPIKRLYQKLGALNARSVTVAMDACFTGAGGRSVLAKGARPLVAKADMGAAPQGKLTVFAAAASDEITSSLEEQGHGLFTYYFLKGLAGAAKDSSGAVTARGLYNYLKPKVQDEARRQNRGQTPALAGAADGELARFK